MQIDLKPQRRTSLGVLLLTAAALLIVSCGPQEIVEEPFEPTSSHSDYREGLVSMEIADTAIGSRWIAESERAIEEPHTVDLPYREIAHFEPTRPEAVGFQFEALRGQRIEITLELEEGEAGRMFADVFRVEEEDVEALPQVASYSEELNRLEFEPRRDSEYILRLQPELLRGGRFTVTIQSVPSISFPVEGHGTDDIWSVFGDGRDGGRRTHEGVDIFAPRHTPVLAVAEGRVRHVGQLPRGCRTVSVTDSARGLTYYYAHLEEQLVGRGATVNPGDPVGTVGNSGNAETTPPHLHFGIYEGRWNAIEPWNFLYQYETEPPPVRGNTDLIGSGARVSSPSTQIDEPGATDFTVSQNEEVVVLGATDDRYRVLLPSSGVYGYLQTSAIEATDVASEGMSMNGS